jgi:hypothetical protein
LVIVQAESLVSELLPKDAILFAEIIKRVTLLLAQPTGDRNQQESKRVKRLAHSDKIAANTAVTGSRSCTI